MAMFGERTLADHAAAVIAPFVETVVRVGGGGIPDLPRPGLGPLGGIAGALDHGARHGFDAVLTIACDTPVVPEGVIAALLRETPSYCVDVPVLGLWPVDALEPLLKLLCSPAKAGAQTGSPPSRGHKGLSIRAFARSIDATAIEAPAPIPNVNTREDLLAL